MEVQFRLQIALMGVKNYIPYAIQIDKKVVHFLGKYLHFL